MMETLDRKIFAEMSGGLLFGFFEGLGIDISASSVCGLYVNFP